MVQSAPVGPKAEEKILNVSRDIEYKTIVRKIIHKDKEYGCLNRDASTMGAYTVHCVRSGSTGAEMGYKIKTYAGRH